MTATRAVRRAYRGALLVAFTVLAATAAAPAARGAESIHQAKVYAAASLSDVLNEQAAAFRQAHPFAQVEFNYGGSNVLAQQILHGAPADLYISADERQMKLLEERGRVAAGSVVPLLSNRLVVIVPSGSDTKAFTSAKDLLAMRRLALADPAVVPAGVYARTWLENVKLWDKLASRVVPALDVRAALSAVASGNLPAGIVYATDAASSKAVRVVYVVPESESPRIRYFAAPIAGQRSHLADFFLDFLHTPRAVEIFRNYGFLTLDQDGK